MIYKVSPKDWERMQDLIDRDQDGDGVAAKIKDVNKAAARFIAGTVLYGNREDVLEHTIHWSRFVSFAKKALDLGASAEELIESLKVAQVPDGFKGQHVTKKQYSGYTGTLERFLDKAQKEYGVELTKGHADYHDWSWETKQQYRRNGLVWPLNYRYVARKNGKEVSFTIIVVTNESGGLYGYDFNGYRRPWRDIKSCVGYLLRTLINP